MKNIIKKTIGYGFLFIAMALIILLVEDKVSTDLYIPYKETVVILVLISIFAIVGTIILASILTKKELKLNMMFTILCVIMLAYLITLFKVLFLDRTEVSTSHNIYSKDMRTLNLVPFETIKLFQRSWKHGYLNKGLIVSNICGNIVMFMPMVILLWCLIKKLRKPWLLAIINAAIIIIVEVCQYIFSVGSCDIDDFILNMIGVIIACVIVGCKFFSLICKKLYIIE